jgi:hypothetical protein
VTFSGTSFQLALIKPDDQECRFEGPCVHSGTQKSPIQIPQGIIVSPWARNSTFFDLWGRVVGSLVAFLRIGLHFVCPREKGAAISDVLWKTFCHKFMETMAAVQPRSTRTEDVVQDRAPKVPMCSPYCKYHMFCAVEQQSLGCLWAPFWER